MYTPERMCAVCRKRLSKENLLRIAVNSDGVRVDFSGKLQGRGAYLCKDSACIDKCIKKRMLERILKTEVPSQIYETLQSVRNGQEKAE